MYSTDFEKLDRQEIANILTEQKADPASNYEEHQPSRRSAHDNVETETVHSRKYKTKHENGARHGGCYSIIRW